MLQPATLASYRKKQLKLSGLMLVVLLVLFWVEFSMHFNYPGTFNHWIEGSTTAFVLSMVVSGVILALSYFLYQGHQWAWWGVFFIIVDVPAFIMLITLFPFFGGLFWIILHNDVLFPSPLLESLTPNTVPQDIDSLAAAMHVQWEEQPLWNLVSLAKQGKLSEAVRTIRQTDHLTWDEADIAIRRWMMDDVGLKVHLLKLHAQKVMA